MVFPSGALSIFAALARPAIDDVGFVVVAIFVGASAEGPDIVSSNINAAIDVGDVVELVSLFFVGLCRFS